MRTYDFATVVSSSPDRLVTSHVPVLVRPSGPTLVIVGHMARANHHWRLMDGATPALVVFHGPHGYVSPTWYETAPAVPTWNYGVVHAHGLPRANEDDAFVRGVLWETGTLGAPGEAGASQGGDPPHRRVRRESHRRRASHPVAGTESCVVAGNRPDEA